MIACLDGIGSGGGAGASRGAGSGGKHGAGKGGKGAGRGKGAGKGEGKARSGKAMAGGQPAKALQAAVSDSSGARGPWPAFIEMASAPLLSRHHPALDEPALRSHFDAKRAAREQRIATLVAEAEREGRSSERIVAAIIHDSEVAPMSTNRRQLAEIGVECPAPGQVTLSDAESHEALWRIVYGLAFLGIYLSSTDHLDDRALLRILASRILDESIRDVPPSADMSEFIDLGPCRPEDAATVDGRTAAKSCATPDGLEGPFEHAARDEDDDDDPLSCGGSHHGREEEGTGWRRVADRDRLLPRPRRPNDGLSA